MRFAELFGMDFEAIFILYGGFVNSKPSFLLHSEAHHSKR